MTLDRMDELERIRREFDDAMVHWANDKGSKYPMITLTYAQSIDGCIAVRKGSPTTLSGSSSMTMTHMLRTLHQGIVIGIESLLSDNPSLTARLVSGRQPKPIVIDTKLRCPLDCKLISDSSCLKPVVVCGNADTPTLRLRKQSLEQAGVIVIECDTMCTSDGTQHVHLSRAFELLYKHGFQSIMVEGGAGIITSCLKEQTLSSLVSLVIITIAPIFIGGLHSVNSIVSSSSFPRLQNTLCVKMDIDMVLVGKFLSQPLLQNS
ncbi:unnamed protein product [Albugo candida]|uniref:Bacterial bifunctional deaminase-reductase C-terminal domain-containing protein n=1 Tax=Albugo candida TaxID=65357 RepID=A0A024GBZ5_9STRA|nr:unnamed protein product [Albugo candida]|eukprot:CCI44199.1 unnamed protein product [Albugo candida]